MKDYYSILGLSRTATSVEIKRAWRRLAVLYHPDKNPDPSAELLFKEINAAYDVLGDAEKKMVYDRQLENPFDEIFQQAQQPSHRDPAYHRRRPNMHYKSEKERMLELMAPYQKAANGIILISFIVSLFLALDYFCPYRVAEEKIIEAENYRTALGRSSTAWWKISTDKNHIYDLPFRFSDHFESGMMIKVRSSVFFNVPFSIEHEEHRAKVYKSIYGNFIFAPAVLLICSIVGMLSKKNTEQSFSFGVVNAILLIVNTGFFIIFRP